MCGAPLLLPYSSTQLAAASRCSNTCCSALWLSAAAVPMRASSSSIYSLCKHASQTAARNSSSSSSSNSRRITCRRFSSLLAQPDLHGVAACLKALPQRSALAAPHRCAFRRQASAALSRGARSCSNSAAAAVAAASAAGEAATAPSASAAAAGKEQAASNSSSSSSSGTGGSGPLALLTPEQRRQAEAYLDLMLETNESLNLTAVRDRDEALVRHIGDSLALLPVLDAAVAAQQQQQQQGQQQQGQQEAAAGIRLIDVGSGAGLPGMVLAIARPQWRVTLLDSLRKRVDFMARAAEALGLSNVDAVWARAEEAGRDAAHREAHDVATARAVADLRILAELCLPLVRPGGAWVAAKGPDPGAEVEGAARAVQSLGGAWPPQIERVDSCSSSSSSGSGGGGGGGDGEGGRAAAAAAAAPKSFTAVVVRKAQATPDKYPRRPGMPNKRPL